MTRLIISFICVLLIPSLVIGYTSYQAAKLKLDDGMANTAQENVELLDKTINQFFDAKIKSVEFFSSRITADMLQDEDSPLLREELKQFKQLHPELLITFVGTKDKGYMIIQSRRKSIRKGSIQGKGHGILKPSIIKER